MIRIAASAAVSTNSREVRAMVKMERPIGRHSYPFKWVLKSDHGWMRIERNGNDHDNASRVPTPPHHDNTREKGLPI